MNENLFNTQSSRDARILARRKRIQERLSTMREGDVMGECVCQNNRMRISVCRAIIKHSCHGTKALASN